MREQFKMKIKTTATEPGFEKNILRYKIKFICTSKFCNVAKVLHVEVSVFTRTKKFKAQNAESFFYIWLKTILDEQHTPNFQQYQKN